MRNYNTACSSLRLGQLDKLMNNLHDGGRGMMSPVKCSCGADKNVCVDCLIDGFEEVYKSLEATLHELEQWNLTEGEETACSILKDGFRVLKKYHMNLYRRQHDRSSNTTPIIETEGEINSVGKNLQKLAKNKSLESDSMFHRKKTLEIGKFSDVELKAWEMASEFKTYCQLHDISPGLIVDGVAWNAAAVIRRAEVDATDREWERVKLILEEKFGL